MTRENISPNGIKNRSKNSNYKGQNGTTEIKHEKHEPNNMTDKSDKSNLNGSTTIINRNKLNQNDIKSGNSQDILQYIKIQHQTHESIKDKNGVILKEKIFKTRNSYLVDLYENPHIQTLYHIFFVCLILGVLSVFTRELISNGKLNVGFGMARKGFAKFHIFLLVWSILQFIVFMVHPIFKLWAYGYNFFSNRKLCTVKKVWNISWITMTTIFQIGFFIFSIKASQIGNFGLVCQFSILTETARFIMKTHAFIRTNAEAVVKGNVKTKSGKEEFICTGASFMKYLYFLFSSTLLYRDEYPRTNSIRWKYVLWHFSEVVAVVLLFGIVYEPSVHEKFKNTGLVPITLEDLVVTVILTSIPGIILMLGNFYIILHAWNNAMAELLRFGDRLFYTDWWNTSTFGEFYRQWNIIVHDWLYTYIYKDVYLHIFKGSKILASIVTFTVSAMVHEIILSFSLKFFLPVQLIFFNFFGVILFFVNSKKYRRLGNCILWLFLMLGSGMMVSFYSMEYFARQNCPVGDTFIDYIKPVVFSCNKIIVNPNWTFKIY